MVLELEQETGTELDRLRAKAELRMKPKRIQTQTGRKLKRGGNSNDQLELRATLAKSYDVGCMERSADEIKINLAILHHCVVALVKSPDC